MRGISVSYLLVCLWLLGCEAIEHESSPRAPRGLVSPPALTQSVQLNFPPGSQPRLIIGDRLAQLQTLAAGEATDLKRRGLHRFLSHADHLLQAAPQYDLSAVRYTETQRREYPLITPKACLKVIGSLGLGVRARGYTRDSHPVQSEAISTRAWVELAVVTDPEKFPYRMEMEQVLQSPGSRVATSHYILAGPLAMSCMAIALDWLAPVFTPAQKADLRAHLLDFMDVTLGYVDRLMGTEGKAHTNLNGIVNGNLGLAALAVLGEEEFVCTSPSLTTERASLCQARRWLPAYLESFSDTGFAYEGSSYVSFALDPVVAFGHTLDHVSSSTDDFLQASRLARVMGVYASTISPSSSAFANGRVGWPTHLGFLQDNQGDSVGHFFESPKKMQAPSAALLYRFAGYTYGVGAARLADQIYAHQTSPAYTHMWRTSLEGYFDFLTPIFYHHGATREAPPRHQQWIDEGGNLDMVIVNRDEADGHYLRVKGGVPREVAHSQLDAGSIILDALGIRWVTDLGRNPYVEHNFAWLSDPFTFYETSNRWQYFRNNPEGHSGPILGRHFPSPVARVRITGRSIEGSRRSFVLDLSDSYSHIASQVLRRVVSEKTDDSIRLEVEDTVTLRSEAHFEEYDFIASQFVHCVGDSQTDPVAVCPFERRSSTHLTLSRSVQKGVVRTAHFTTGSAGASLELIPADPGLLPNRETSCGTTRRISRRHPSQSVSEDTNVGCYLVRARVPSGHYFTQAGTPNTRSLKLVIQIPK